MFQQSTSSLNEESDKVQLENGGVNTFYEKEVRNGFLRKVFGLVTIQLFITALVTVLFYNSKNAQSFVMNNGWTLILPIIGTFAILITMMCVEHTRKSFPLNYIMLFSFTACESFMVAVASCQYQTDILLMAFVVTTGISIALTLFALQTKYDFTTYGGFLVSVLTGLLLTSFVGIFLQSNVLNVAISGVSAVLFSMYIVYDVQLMMGGSKDVSIEPDEYIMAVINLYLDIINLFLAILRILQQASNNN